MYRNVLTQITSKKNFRLYRNVLRHEKPKNFKKLGSKLRHFALLVKEPCSKKKKKRRKEPKRNSIAY